MMVRWAMFGTLLAGVLVSMREWPHSQSLPTPPVPGKSLPGAVTLMPEVLDLWIGGFSGPDYHVVNDGGSLVYTQKIRTESGAQETTVRIRPTEVQWRQFWSTMDRLDVWSWQAAYQGSPLVADGTSWRLDLGVGGRRVRTWGRNNYPPEPPGTIPTPGEVSPGPLFRSYQQAVESVLGGEPFR